MSDAMPGKGTARYYAVLAHDQDAYYGARPQVDTGHNRAQFEAGYKRAWQAALEHAGRGVEPVAHMTLTGQFSMADERGVPPDDSGDWIPLYTHPPAPVVPEGWKLVPVDPTTGMEVAGMKAALSKTRWRNVWSSMINATPEPPNTEISADYAKTPDFTGWYCSQCQRSVDPNEVTFHETHEECGRVITNDEPTRSASLPRSWAIDPACVSVATSCNRSDPHCCGICAVKGRFSGAGG